MSVLRFDLKTSDLEENITNKLPFHFNKDMLQLVFKCFNVTESVGGHTRLWSDFWSSRNLKQWVCSWHK